MSRTACCQHQLLSVLLSVTCYLLLLPQVTTTSSNNNNNFADEHPTDYCEDETFHTECAEDEIVVMQSARYGRMKSGRCISAEYGTLGCWRDVMTYFDQKCSGRRSCDVDVRDLVVESESACTKELRSYLLASYTCLKVTQVTSDQNQCRGGQLSVVAPPGGYLASIVTQTTGCGGIDAPWLIHTDPGQRINISLIDFSEREEQLSPGGALMCQVLAVVKEEGGGGRSETICRGGLREQHVYQSLTNQVEIRLMIREEEPGQQPQYLLKYETIGCPAIPVNDATWFNRTLSGATVGCKSNERQWKLLCTGSKWKGTYYNCTKAGEKIIAGNSQESTNKNTWNLGISIAVVVAIALAIGTLVLVVGLICVRRRHGPPPRPTCHPNVMPARKSQPKTEYYMSTDHPGTMSGSLPPGGAQDPTQYPGFGENAYFRTWELQRPTTNNNYPASNTTDSLPPYSQAVDSQDRDRYSEHIYESPKSLRRDTPHVNGTESLQYYELDPQAMDKGGPPLEG